MVTPSEAVSEVRYDDEPLPPISAPDGLEPIRQSELRELQRDAQKHLSPIRQRIRPRILDTPVIDSRFPKKYRSFIPSGYSATYLGAGNNGSVFALKHPSKESFAIKFSLNNYNLEEEAEMQTKFANVGLAPRVIRAEKNYILMDRIDSTLSDVYKRFPNNNPNTETVCYSILSELKRILKTMRQHRLTHADMHTDNIAVVSDMVHYADGTSRIVYRLLLIDFGWANDLSAETRFDLGRAMEIDEDDFQNQELRKCLLKTLNSWFKELTGKKYNYEVLERAYHKYLDKFR